MHYPFFNYKLHLFLHAEINSAGWRVLDRQVPLTGASVIYAAYIDTSGRYFIKTRNTQCAQGNTVTEADVVFGLEVKKKNHHIDDAFCRRIRLKHYKSL